MFRAAILSLFLGTTLFSQTQPPFTYETVTVADGIYAFIAHQPGVALFSGNSVAIVGDDAVLVVDSGQFPSITKQFIRDIRSRTSKPVRYLVNTHWHGDHNTGNAAFQQELPSIAIISTPATRNSFADLREKALVAKQIAGFAPVVKSSLATGNTPDGKPLDAATRQYFERLQPEFDFALPELKDVKSVAPNFTFNDNLNIYLGTRRVEIKFLGRGNTAGDAAVYIPDAKVLITGDLVVAPIPFAHGSFVSEWIETLKKLESFDTVAFVPGHGPIQRDKTYLQLVATALREIDAQSMQAATHGQTLEQALKQISLPELRKRFTNQDPKLERDFDNFFLQPAIRRAYREAKEGPLKDENF